MHTANANGTQRSDSGLLYMWLSVVGASLLPLAIVFGNGGDSPFLFSAAMRLGHVLAFCAFLAATFRRILLRRDVLWLVVRRVLAWSMLISIASRFEFALFAWATHFINISAVVMLFELQTVLTVLFSSFLFIRYKGVSVDKSLLLLVGLLGFCFIAAGEVGGFGNLGDLGRSNAFVGILLAVLAAAAASLAVFVNRWGISLSRELPEEAVKNEGIFLLELGCVIIGQLIGNLVGTALLGTVGLVRGESIALESVGLALAFGTFATGLAIVARRAAQLATKNLGVNALAYATPVFSLAWLYLFWEIDISRYDYLAIGIVSIIAVNLLLNFEAEIRHGFKAMIVSLWSCGTFVYLRDELLRFLPFEDWLWPEDLLLGVLGLAATVFILLLSFRVLRLAARTQVEDDMIFRLFQSVDLLVRRGIVDEAIQEHILAIDAAHSPEELRDAYLKTRACLSAAFAASPEPDEQARLAEAQEQLNVIVYSRRHGVEFGELFALIIFAGITVLLALMGRPTGLLGWPAFLFELFAFSFSAVIIFLLVNVWDLHHDRTSHILERQSDGDDYSVVFRDTRNRNFERVSSTVIGMLIAITFFALLWYKWMPASSL